MGKGVRCPQLQVIDPVPSLPCPKTASHEELGILLSSQDLKTGVGVPPAFLPRPIQLHEQFSEPASILPMTREQTGCRWGELPGCIRKS